MQEIHIRLAAADEAAKLLQIHHASVEGLCAGQYNAEQIAHWFDGRDETAYAQGLAQQRLWVACVPEPVGFIELDACSIEQIVGVATGGGFGRGQGFAFAWLAGLTGRGQTDGRH